MQAALRLAACLIQSAHRAAIARSPILSSWSCRRANPRYRPCQSGLFASCRLELCAGLAGCSCACRELWRACESSQPSSSRMPCAQKKPASGASERSSGVRAEWGITTHCHASTELRSGLVNSAHNQDLFRHRGCSSTATPRSTKVRNIHGMRGVHSAPCPNPPSARTAVGRWSRPREACGRRANGTSMSSSAARAASTTSRKIMFPSRVCLLAPALVRDLSPR
jgi:hypothetical protein